METNCDSGADEDGGEHLHAVARFLLLLRLQLAILTSYKTTYFYTWKYFFLNKNAFCQRFVSVLLFIKTLSVVSFLNFEFFYYPRRRRSTAARM